MRIVISNQSGKPIYEQIEDQVKTAILAGQLKANEQLLSAVLLKIYVSA